VRSDLILRLWGSAVNGSDAIDREGRSGPSRPLTAASRAGKLCDRISHRRWPLAQGRAGHGPVGTQ
jgi:hypothetical protein